MFNDCRKYVRVQRLITAALWKCNVHKAEILLGSENRLWISLLFVRGTPGDAILYADHCEFPRYFCSQVSSLSPVHYSSLLSAIFMHWCDKVIRSYWLNPLSMRFDGCKNYTPITEIGKKNRLVRLSLAWKLKREVLICHLGKHTLDTWHFSFQSSSSGLAKLCIMCWT